MENQKNQKNPKKNNFSGLEKYARYSGMAFQMVAIILLSVWSGKKIDEIIHPQGPLFIIIFSLIGVFGAIYISLKDFIRKK